MNCPVDQVPLAITERQGVEIDYCPQCRGVWLDRGELDKLIERTAGMSWEPQRGDPRPREREHDRDHDHDRDRDRDWDRDRERHGYGHEGGYDQRHRRKRKGLLGEIFDFD